MSEKPKRPWFRFHLLTAVLMMIASGGILWLNVRDRRGPPKQGDTDLGMCDIFREHERGWPFRAFYAIEVVTGVAGLVQPNGEWMGSLVQRQNGKWIPMGTFPDTTDGELLRLVWSPNSIVCDSAIGLALIIAVALASESIIRRREGRKP